MPALRMDREVLSYKPYTKIGPEKLQQLDSFTGELTPPVTLISVVATRAEFPTSPGERNSFRTPAGKKVTPHQWAVYDFTFSIPCGRVSTYKYVCAAIGQGSPRSVGTALRNNPFAPTIPCHRVVASNNFIGGFFGEWGKDSKTGTQFGNKVALLESEGVVLTQKGFLEDPNEVIWRGDPLTGSA